MKKIIVTLLLMVLASLCVGKKAMAQEWRLYFRHDKSEIDTTFCGNGESMGEISQAVSSYLHISRLSMSTDTSSTGSITVKGMASPVGRTAYNEALAGRRAEAVADFIRTLPGMATKKIITVSVGEDWETFTEDIEQNYHRANRQQLLDILYSDMPSQEKKNAIWHLDKDVYTWHYIVRHNMHSSRYSSMVVIHAPEINAIDSTIVPPVSYAVVLKEMPSLHRKSPTETATPAKTDAPKKNSATEKKGEKSQQQSQTGNVVSAKTVARAKTSATGKKEEKEQSQECNRVPLMALRTNLAVPALNFGAEVPIGNNWSVGADYYFPWVWPNAKNEKCWEILAWSVEGRWWIGRDRKASDRLKGHSLGVYFAGGYYDFEKNYRGLQGQFISPGIDYMYSLGLGKKKLVHMEFSLALGYIHSRGRAYSVPGEYGPLYPDDAITKWSYIGPTKITVGLVVPIYRKEGRK